MSQPDHASIDALGIAWRLGATLFFVILNGFFVAAEFALVKVRVSRIDELAAGGLKRAASVRHILRHLDRYLSSCQLGITISSLILGALGEPAVSVLVLAAVGAFGIQVSAGPWLPIVSIGLAFAVITMLHMTLGEQAPKMWALRRAEATSLRVSRTLRAFTFVFGPFIVAVNGISNWMLRLAGLSGSEGHHDTPSAEEIRSILSVAASSGHISDREYELTENVFRMISLEVRHLVVPRVDVEFLSLEKSIDENLAKIRTSLHSRLPLCEVGLDTVVGMVHAKDALDRALAGELTDLRTVAREAIFVPDTMALSDFLLELQAKQGHCAVVVDERGTAIGLAFREDALEEIVGPLGDEFDERQSQFKSLGDGVYELSGRLSMPEVCDRLDIELDAEEDESEDTIGGHVTARLGRLPHKGDTTQIGPFDAVVLDATRRRVQRLRMERRTEPREEQGPATSEPTEAS